MQQLVFLPADIVGDLEVCVPVEFDEPAVPGVVGHPASERVKTIAVLRVEAGVGELADQSEVDPCNPLVGLGWSSPR